MGHWARANRCRQVNRRSMPCLLLPSSQASPLVISQAPLANITASETCALQWRNVRPADPLDHFVWPAELKVPLSIMVSLIRAMIRCLVITPRGLAVVLLSWQRCPLVLIYVWSNDFLYARVVSEELALGWPWDWRDTPAENLYLDKRAGDPVQCSSLDCHGNSIASSMT